MNVLRNRAEAGRLLAERLRRYADRADAVVLALPRGGVPVAYEIACELRLPLDVLVVRKIGVPNHRELAMGAVASDGSSIVNDHVIDVCGVSRAEFAAALENELHEAHRREEVYRQGRPQPSLRGKTALVVDDGLATGSTMRVAIGAVRKQGASRVVVAVPVSPPDTHAQLAHVADEIVCLLMPAQFQAVGAYYASFEQVADAQVQQLLASAAAREHAA